jgi:hypothetical protein
MKFLFTKLKNKFEEIVYKPKLIEGTSWLDSLKKGIEHGIASGQNSVLSNPNLIAFKVNVLIISPKDRPVDPTKKYILIPGAPLRRVEIQISSSNSESLTNYLELKSFEDYFQDLITEANLSQLVTLIPNKPKTDVHLDDYTRES